MTQGDEWRERWKRKHNWNVKELAKLCCGWDPSDGAIPDPRLYNEVVEAIRRAIQARALITLDLLWPATDPARFYGEDALFSPPVAAAWAAQEYSDTFVYAADPTLSTQLTGSRAETAMPESARSDTTRKSERPALIGPSGTTATPVESVLGTRSQRRAAVDAYIAEVFQATGERLTRTEIWKLARYTTRTEFERWERCDPKTTKTATERFQKILSEKPHLK